MLIKGHIGCYSTVIVQSSQNEETMSIADIIAFRTQEYKYFLCLF